MSVKDLASVSETERNEFISSVDNIICDLDGVVWLFGKPIEGASDCLDDFRSLGKKIMFVTNNCVLEIDWLKNKIESSGFGKDPTVINPTLVLVHYLKSINFNKKIYVVASQCIKRALKDAGFEYVEHDSGTMNVDLYSLPALLIDDESIGAVLLDWETNINFMKLQKAIVYLGRPEVLFLVGATDHRLPGGKNITLIGNTSGDLLVEAGPEAAILDLISESPIYHLHHEGPKYFQTAVEEITGRKPTAVSKPSEALKNYIQQELDAGDPSKTLFIGDTITQDMAFAALSGYKKLLVLSGIAQEKDVVNWQSEEQNKPDYYINDLGLLHKLLSKTS